VDARNAEAWAWRGLAFERSNRRAEAAESYQGALSADPNNTTARQGLARVQGGGGGGGLASVFR